MNTAHASSNDRPYLLGLDIGGTKLGLSVGRESGEIVAREQTSMDGARRPEDVLADALERLKKLVRDAGASWEQIGALGAACPGPFSYEHGQFLDPPNMPTWHGFKLREWLGNNVPCPSAMMNDANATVLAEWMWGAARGANTAVYLTMSTGMGAGLIVNGQLFEGPQGLAGEIGRIRLRDDGPVGFAKRGSVEGFLSGPGMCQLAAQEAIICRQRGEASVLADRYVAHGTITTEELCDGAAKGDAAAVRVTDRIAHELGRLLAILNDVLNPEVIVLGTIGTHYPQLFIPGAMRVMIDEGVSQSAGCVRVVPSSLTHRGDQSAIAVAVRLLQQSAATSPRLTR